MEVIIDKIRNNKYKEELPQKTVKKIKDILNAMHIETEEQWVPVSEIGTYSLRVNVKGTLIGSNGKGMTKDYASASAYAEFIERLQNNKLQANATLSTVLRYIEEGHFLYPDEKILTSKELAEGKNSFIKMFAEKRGIKIEEINDVSVLLQSSQKMDYNLIREKDRFLCVPYYSVKEKKVTYVPYFAANLHYGSNGMCAGNSKSEALVQGLSEIIERMIQTKIVMEQLELPNIPEEFLKGYPSIYEMYQKAKALKGYTVLLKDCSFGGKYPAAALIVSEKSTGRFGVKVGCHPEYSIAIERLFTEATQGMSLERFAKKTVFDFYNMGISSSTNLMNGYKTADAKFPFQLFSDESSYEFVEPEDMKGYDNSGLLNWMLKFFIEQGYDVLIHDVSFLDFPSYHIIVPGFSEINYPEASGFEAENTRFHIQPLINQPELITPENCKYVISVVEYFKYSLVENSMKNLSGSMAKGPFPASDLNMDQHYFLAMLNAFLGKYDEARKEIHAINLVIKRENIVESAAWFSLIEYYFSGMAVLQGHKKVLDYLEKLYDHSMCEKIDELFGDREKILTKQYASHSISKVKESGLEQVSSQLEEYFIFEEICKKYREVQKSHRILQEVIGDSIVIVP